MSRAARLLIRAFEFNCVTWSPHTKQDIEKVEKVQLRFTKRLRGLHKLELCSLELPRLYFDLHMCYRIIFGQVNVCIEFGQPFWVAYVELKSAFDSVDTESLWLLLYRLVVLEKIVGLVQALYTDARTCTCVQVDSVCSDWFEVVGEVRQGCAIASDLFLAPADWIMQRTLERSSLGVNIGCQSFTDLDYADARRVAPYPNSWFRSHE